MVSLVVFAVCASLASANIDAQNCELDVYVSRIAKKNFIPGRPVFVSVPQSATTKTNGYDVDVTLLQQLHSSEKWPIIVSVGKVSEEALEDIVKAESYVIFVSNDFFEQITYIASRSSWNPKGNFILVLPSTSSKGAIVNMLNTIWTLQVVNVVTVGRVLGDSNDMSFGTYTWFPYQQANACELVRDVTLLHSCSIKDYYSSEMYAFPEKIPQDFQGCPLKILTENFPPYAEGERIISDEHNTTRVEYESGWEIQMMATLAVTLNLTPEYYLPIGECKGRVSRYDVFPFFLCSGAHAVMSSLMLRAERLQVADATTFYDTTTITWHVPCSRKIPHTSSISRVFAPSTLCILGLSVIVAALLFTFLGKHGGTSAYRQLASSMSDACASVLGSSVPIPPRSNPVRVFFIFWLYYSYVLDLLLQSLLTTYLIDTGRYHAISSVEELFSSDLKLLLLKSEEVSFNEIFNKYCSLVRSRIIHCSGFVNCMEHLEANDYRGKLAALSGERVIQWIFRTNKAKYALCPLERGTLYRTVSVIYLAKGSPLLKSFNTILARFIEAGLVEHWRKLIENQELTDGSEVLSEYSPLSKGHLKAAFITLLLGLVSSLGVFLLELIYTISLKNLTR